MDSFAKATESEALPIFEVFLLIKLDLCSEVKLLNWVEVPTRMTSSRLLELTTAFWFVKSRPSTEITSFVLI